MLKFLSRLILAPLARLIFRPRIVGKANVPKSGPVLIAVAGGLILFGAFSIVEARYRRMVIA